MVKEKHLTFDWYQKPIFLGRFLNYFSNHLISQKKGIIFGLVDRVLLLYDSEFYHKNLTLIVNILIENDYPLKFIFNAIYVRNIQREGSVVRDCTNNSDETSWFTVPFVPSIIEKFKKFNREDIKVFYYSSNKLSKFIKVQKNSRSNWSKNNIVYKIICKDCDASYVGQMSRQLKIRITEYRNHICWNTSIRSVHSPIRT